MTENQQQNAFQGAIESEYKLYQKFDHYLKFPKGSKERAISSADYREKADHYPSDLTEFLLRMACMLSPDTKMYQKLWLAELDKLLPQAQLHRIAKVGASLEQLKPLRRQEERQSSFYTHCIANRLLTLQPLNKMEGGEDDAQIKAEEIHRYLDKTLQPEQYCLFTDKAENIRRGKLIGKKLEDDKILRPGDKAASYIKIALLTDNTQSLTEAEKIKADLQSQLDQITETMAKMKELTKMKPANAPKFNQYFLNE